MPMSLAYSGSICCTGLTPPTPICQISTSTRKIVAETMAARRLSDEVIQTSGWLQVASCTSFDGEAVDVLFRFGWIEGLAHHDESLRGRRGRREADLLHQLRCVGCKEDLLGDGRVIDLALDLPPALHLRHDPDRKGFPWERIEIDTIGNLPHSAEAVGESPGEHLLD